MLAAEKLPFIIDRSGQRGRFSWTASGCGYRWSTSDAGGGDGQKARFLTQVVKSMGLGQRVSVLPERAEALAGQPRLRSSFDLATARGLGRLDVIMELALPLIASGGFLIALKSAGQLGQELPRASRSAALLGGSVLPVETLKELLPDRDHVLVIIKKENETPDTYPRPYPLIKRCPLGRASF